MSSQSARAGKLSSHEDAQATVKIAVWSKLARLRAVASSMQKKQTLKKKGKRGKAASIIRQK